MILGFIILPMFIQHHQLQPQINSNAETVVKTSKYSKQLIELLLETFFYGRILFFVGYLFGILTGL
jgi:hypothetical protein